MKTEKKNSKDENMKIQNSWQLKIYM